ncbi:hypothetical protein EMIT0P43_20046 [Pseudomonas jessenii]
MPNHAAWCVLVINTALSLECAHVANEYFVAISDTFKQPAFCDGNNPLVPLWKHRQNDWIPDFSDIHTDATNGILGATMPPVS